eukprot:364597-Chlamydomonas_euryale.AAC.19
MSADAQLGLQRRYAVLCGLAHASRLSMRRCGRDDTAGCVVFRDTCSLGSTDQRDLGLCFIEASPVLTRFGSCILGWGFPRSCHASGWPNERNSRDLNLDARRVFEHRRPHTLVAPS